MNETQRHHEILSLLKENQIINVSFITEHFNISPATARRDIAKLDEQGKLKKYVMVRSALKRKTQMVTTEYQQYRSLRREITDCGESSGALPTRR